MSKHPAVNREVNIKFDIEVCAVKSLPESLAQHADNLKIIFEIPGSSKKETMMTTVKHGEA